jgi:hypothetical protein
MITGCLIHQTSQGLSYAANPIRTQIWYISNLFAESTNHVHPALCITGNAGPLEATIRNIQRELQKKDVEGKEAQRLWISLQTELVAKQNANVQLTESHARLTSNFSILCQKKVGLQHELEREQKEVSTQKMNFSHFMKMLGDFLFLCFGDQSATMHSTSYVCRHAEELA